MNRKFPSFKQRSISVADSQHVPRHKIKTPAKRCLKIPGLYSEALEQLFFVLLTQGYQHSE
jgi:hypothetical protein